tara:strand:+ start:320 stop:1702 length:1383 start_codon:yes stop_codon:yes gene_type:complete
MFLSKTYDKNNKPLVINLLFCLLPLSIIIGSLIVNINIILFIIFSLTFFYEDFLKFKLNKIDKLILFLFIFITFSGAFNLLENFYFPKEVSPPENLPPKLQSIYLGFVKNYDLKYLILKSIGYLRFFLLYFAIRVLLEKKILNIKYFFYTSSIFCFFVMLDVIFQFVNGKNTLGMISPHPRKVSGPFGDELIAGGYIQNFSFFLIFLPIFFERFKKFLKFYIIFIISLIILSIIISGNRMPLLLFLITLGFFSIFKLENIKYFILILVISFLSISFFKYIKPSINQNISHFQASVKNMIFITNKIIKGDFKDEDRQRNDFPEQFREFETSYDTWKLNKYIGGGVRSYRFNCTMRKNIEINERITCNTHPHNYYLEIISDLGIFGLSLVIILFSIVFFKSIKTICLKTDKNNIIAYPFLMIFFAEIFPIKSSGSFFYTLNSLIIFVSMAILVTFLKRDNIS